MKTKLNSLFNTRFEIIPKTSKFRNIYNIGIWIMIIGIIMTIIIGVSGIAFFGFDANQHQTLKFWVAYSFGLVVTGLYISLTAILCAKLSRDNH